MKRRVLMAASVASMIDQFNMPNIRLMQELGYEVHVACNFEKGNTCNRRRICALKKMLQNRKVIWHQWDCPRSIYAGISFVRAYRQMKVLADRYQFEWIHCYSPIGGALARAAAHWAGIPVIYTAHGFHFYKGAPLKNWLLYYPAEKLLSYWTDLLITVNQEDFRFAKRHLRARKICRIPGIGINVKQFADAGRMDQCGACIRSTDQCGSCIHRIDKNYNDRSEFCRYYHIPMNAVILLSVGELNKGKNHKLVIWAMSQLKQQNIYYLICGQGTLRLKLQRYADRMGVGKRIRMPGYQENMPWIYRHADLFVFPSVREGMPVALMEAMASGMPCIASDIRGSRELIGNEACKDDWRNETELCFSLRKKWQLCSVLEKMIEDEAFRRYCGTNNQKKIWNYDQAVVLRKMKKIYYEESV